MSENLAAIRGALSFLGTTSTAKVTSNAVPTARTRAALDLLASSTPEQLIADQVNLRELTENLYNWSDEPKASKTIMRALQTALFTEGKYSHAVELVAYTVALAPLLQPDRLARLFDSLNHVETAFAPARYTLQFSAKLKWLLSRYAEERREKLAYSLWVEAHTGRWWDLTAGQARVAVAPQGEVAVIEQNELVRMFSERTLPWTADTAEQFSAITRNEKILETLGEYNDDLLRERVVDPDTALLSSYLPWLTPSERPESPVGNLLDTIKSIIQQVEYDLPEKPKKFSELFPDIKLYGATEFPFPLSVLQTDGRLLTPNARMELVRNATQLAENRTYMGNCTWSYKNQMEKGEYALYRIHIGEDIYNAAMTTRSNKTGWSVREINSRFNRGNVPSHVRDSFTRFAESIPAPVADTEVLKNRENYKKLENIKNRKYKFKI